MVVMGWKELDASWRGVIISGTISFISLLGLLFYIVFIVGGIVSFAVWVSIAVLTSVKLIWGVVFGYLLGSFFGKK